MKKKILLAHVPYKIRGGEEIHVEDLAKIYSDMGYEPIFYPNQFNSSYFFDSIQSLILTSTDKKFIRFFEKENPALIHLHNAFPFLGPRFFHWQAKNKKVPLFMTIHNHRFFCTNGLALRNNRNCTDCFSSKILWRSLFFNCNGSLSKTVYHSLALSEMRSLNLYEKAVDCFIAPSPYIQKQLLDYGINEKKIRFVLHPVEKSLSISENNTLLNFKYDVLYAGRLSNEKGIQNLLEAAKLLPKVTFLIIGDGPEKSKTESYANNHSNIHFLGKKSHSEVMNYLQQTRIGILPSICNEILSIFALEVFMQGKYCVTGNTQSMRILQEHGYAIKISRENTPAGLAAGIVEALHLDPISENRQMEIEEKIGIKRFTKQLQDILKEYLV